MKQINVISDFYRNTSINFNGFIIDFDVEGKGVLNFDEEQIDLVENIFEIHPNIYKGDKLPIKKKNENFFDDKKENISIDIEYLKQSNKNLALENASLKKENEILKEEIEILKKENSSFKNFEKDNIESEFNEDTNEKEEVSLKEELNKKTITQLKEILNTSEDFLPFKEEWKGLVKKDEIISYILKKAEE